MGRCNKEIEVLKETNMKTEEESNETELVIETSARQAGFVTDSTFLEAPPFAASLKEKIQELTVEDKMLSMTEIKIKEEVKAMERELLEVGKLIAEEDAIRREKIAGCNAAREMHEAQVSNCLSSSSSSLSPRMFWYRFWDVNISRSIT